MVVLVVGALAEVVAAVVRQIVCPEERIFHLPVSLVGVGIVQSGQYGEQTAAPEFAAAVKVEREGGIGGRFHSSHTPIVVETCRNGVDDAVSQGRQRPLDASGKSAVGAREAQPAQSAAPAEVGRAPVRLVIGRG